MSEDRLRAMTVRGKRATYLIQPDFDRLEDWCQMVFAIFGRPPRLVGSVLEHAGFRDVDVRLVLPDDAFDTMFRHRLEATRFLNRAISVWGREETGLPIDFQVQRASEAEADFAGEPFHPMGVRDWSIIPTSGVPALTQGFVESSTAWRDRDDVDGGHSDR